MVLVARMTLACAKQVGANWATRGAPRTRTSPSAWNRHLRPAASVRGDNPVLSRRTLEALAPAVTFNVAGVSMAPGRQEAIQQMKPYGQKLMLVREPWNVHDPAAVRVFTLGGSLLGYVPRTHTHHFIRDVTFGEVISFGQQVDSQNWGVHVYTQPALVPITIDLLPSALQHQVDEQMQDLFTSTTPLAQSAQAAVAAANNLCQVTGVPTTALRVVPEWHYDEPQRMVKRVRWQVVCGEVAQARHVAELAPGSPPHQQAVLTLINVNHWGEEDVEEHLSYVAARQSQLEGWQLQM